MNRLVDRRAEERARRLEVLVALGGSPEALEEPRARRAHEPLSLDSRVKSYSWVTGRPAAPPPVEPPAEALDGPEAPEPPPALVVAPPPPAPERERAPVLQVAPPPPPPRPGRAPRPKRQRPSVRLQVRPVAAVLVAAAVTTARVAIRLARTTGLLAARAAGVVAPALAHAASRVIAALGRGAHGASRKRTLPRPARTKRQRPAPAAPESESGLTAEQRRLVESYALDETA